MSTTIETELAELERTCDHVDEGAEYALPPTTIRALIREARLLREALVNAVGEVHAHGCENCEHDVSALVSIEPLLSPTRKLGESP